MVQVSMINNFKLQSQNYPPPAMLEVTHNTQQPSPCQERTHPAGKLSRLFKSSTPTLDFLIANTRSLHMTSAFHSEQNAASHFLLSDKGINRKGLILYSPVFELPTNKK
ncbi:hypothetical protein L873DRAFT_1816832 [Choiromyces venosus 120613-1]|uniref:Uncharacterized protein n=1 Tax=Choiromyces venosus 120613-1 TaxID=1336337 RepID=A0A3N4J3I6_9PEZI|nr:hypothetical protein L873DRAFT_1816832 [Choiromyces venosus 120613-1]